jgi:hypothetical protein
MRDGRNERGEGKRECERERSGRVREFWMERRGM